MAGRRLDICIIGMGPRGLSVLERICANARHTGPDTQITVHVVDPHPAGAGKVWRTAQSRHLLMNTVASQVTMFTDDSVDLEGPLAPGPSLYEWARFLTLMGPFDKYQYRPLILEEAAALGPDSYPSRAFYGHYLEWVFHRVVGAAPDHVLVQVHEARAVALDDAAPPMAAAGEDTRTAERGAGDLQTVQLDDGSWLDGLHAVVLAQGHLPTAATGREAALSRFADERELLYFPPANPADADLGQVRPKELVALLGLGLCAFDYIALFTVGRGGRFEREEDGSLTYLASGNEPRLYAGSRRGIPFHSRGENEKGPHGRHIPVVLTPEVIDGLRARASNGGIDFRRDIWPLVAKEVETVYYATSLTASQGVRAAEAFRRRYLALPWDTPEEARLLDTFGFPRDRRWDWERIARPYGDRKFTSPTDFRDWLLDHLRQDIAEARAGNVSGPLKAALDVLRDLRNEVRLLVDHRGLTGRSHRQDLERWYTPLNAFLSIGPPVQRIEEAVALIDAGLLEVLGPDVTAHADDEAGVFAVRAGSVPGSEVWTTALIDARLPDIDVRRTADPLLTYLLVSGACRPHRIPNPDGTAYQTGGLDVTEGRFQLLDASGRPHPRRFAFGVPTEAVHWVTAAGIRPGVNSVTLSDADAIARAALSLAAEVSGTETETTKATV
ncbi:MULTISPECIES: FAD/NAD(P)-binding protein [Streptomyces]|uniref:FAD/NAD(P)-binding protein n=2 Tax=Streptomyces TaxID=1883 RepID=UPI0002FB2E02|nr:MULTISPECIES: FAD/NAD(P)-binding protein [Streptomyces]